MGTKNNPGEFDCYANAAPDEPMMVLLGRDKHAPFLTRLWAILRALDGEDAAKVNEALSCAFHMQHYRGQLQKPPLTDAERELMARLFVVATTGMKEHPDNFDDPCGCDLCLTYGGEG